MQKPTNGPCVTFALAALVSACAADAPRNEAVSEAAALIANALSAAPEHIAREAAVVVPVAMGEVRTLREGTNDWTCLPDNPKLPGNMPMCLDRVGMGWMQAMMRRQPPPDGPVSTAYMLQGSSFPSFDELDADETAAGEWITTGPILMIMNVLGRLEGLASESPNVNEPFVMYRRTPYEHLMVPVGAPAGH